MDVKPEWLIDAMVQASRSHLPADLAGAAKAIGLTQKQSAGKALIKLFADEAGEATPQSHPAEWAQFRSYARDDVAAMRDVFFATMPLHRRMWEEYWASERINHRGVAVDIPFVRGAAALARRLTATANADIERLTEGKIKTVGQNKAILEWVRYELRHLPEVDRILTAEHTLEEDEDGERVSVPKYSLGRKLVEALMGYLKTLNESQGLTDAEWAVLQVLEIRLFGAGATPKKYQKILDHVDFDGRLKGQFIYGGATATIRFSSKGVQCVTGEHEVLTREGWLPIRDAVGAREIMAWNVESDCLRWEKGVVRAFGPAPVARVDSTMVKGVYTWDHRIPQRPWKRLRDTCPKEILTRRASGCITSAAVDQPDAPFTDAQLRILVAMQSDGTWAKKAALWHFSKERKKQRLESLLAEAGVPFKTSQWGDGTWGIRINTDDVPAWLVKDFDPYVLTLSARQAQLVLDEYALWDGWRHAKNEALCVTSPRKDQMEWLATVAALAGQSSTLARYLSRSKNIPDYASWRFYLRNSRTTTIRPDQVTDAGVQDVFCPTVPSGYWLCRYGDRIYITGNTHNLARSTVGTLDDEIDAIEMITERGADAYDAIKARWGYVGKVLSYLIRPAFVAPEGKTLVFVDWSSIQAIICPWVTDDDDAQHLLDAVRANHRDSSLPDLYRVQAGKMLGKPALEITKPERQAYGKTVQLGFQFLGGENSLHAMGRIYGVSFTDEEAREAKMLWRDENKWAMRFGDRVWESVLWCMENPGQPREVGLMTLVYDPGYLKGTLFAVMPNGDPLLYTGIAWREVATKDKTTGEEKTETRLTVRKGRGVSPIWVGEFVNNFVQGIEAAMLRQCLCDMEKAGLKVVLHVHDDICVEVDAGEAKWAESKMLEIMCTNSGWNQGLPIAAEPTTWDWYTKCLG